MQKATTLPDEQDPVSGKGKVEHGAAEDGHSGDPAVAWNQALVFRFVGLGTELAGFTLVIAGLGYLVDAWLQPSKPYATALGALIGFTLGMTRFIQQVKKSDNN